MMTLRIIEAPDSWWDTEVGDTWRAPARDLPEREAWMIHLPINTFWGTTDREYDAANPEWPTNGKLWKVSGEPPTITVHPSINAEPNGWHGSITNGELT